MHRPVNQDERTPHSDAEHGAAHSKEDVPLNNAAAAISTLKDFATSARRWVAEASLAISFPIAAAGIVGSQEPATHSNVSETVQSAERRPEKFTRLEKLSAADTDKIVENFGSRKSDSGTLVQLAKSYLKEQNPKLLNRDTDAWHRNTTGKEIVELLKKMSLDEKCNSRMLASESLSKVEEMLASPLFQKGVKTVNECNPKCVSAAGEIASIWVDGEDEVERFLHIVSSSGFQEYQRTLHAATDLNVESHLPQLERQFSRRLAGEERTVGPELAPWINQFRREVPEISIGTIADASKLLHQVMPNPDEGPLVTNQRKFEEWLSTYKNVVSVLTKDYGVRSGSLSDYGTRIAEGAEIELLMKDEVKELSAYLAREHSEIEQGKSWPPLFVKHESGFVHAFASPIVEVLGTDGPTMNRFLAHYGKEFSDVSLEELGRHHLRNNLTGPKDLIEDPKFAEFLDQQFTSYPNLQRSLTVEQIFQLAAAYDHRSSYESLNNLLLKRSVAPLPDMTLHETAQKEELLSILDENRFDAIKVNTQKNGTWGSYIQKSR